MANEAEIIESTRGMSPREKDRSDFPCDLYSRRGVNARLAGSRSGILEQSFE